MGERKLQLLEKAGVENILDGICHHWRASVNGIVQCGLLLARLKVDVRSGTHKHPETGKPWQWGDVFSTCRANGDPWVPFGTRTAQRLMVIGERFRVLDATHVSHLPASWGTLAILAKLSDEQIGQAIADGRLSAETTQAAAKRIVRDFIPRDPKPRPKRPWQDVAQRTYDYAAKQRFDTLGESRAQGAIAFRKLCDDFLSDLESLIHGAKR